MNVLEEIVANKRLEVARRKLVIPPNHLVRALDLYPVRRFTAALAGGRRIIAEIKRKSPASGPFRAEIDVAELAGTYETSGASAISVVTDLSYFGTTLTDARTVRENASVPLLVKDFIVDPYQVYEARAFGADAVLLIARVLAPTELHSLVNLVRTLGMEALVEVHDRKDLWKAREGGARAIGINNRDLDSFEVSLEVSRELAREIPEDVLSVSESGISSRREIDELTAGGIDAFLIGSALLRAIDPGRLIRELIGAEPVEILDRSSRQSAV